MPVKPSRRQFRPANRNEGRTCSVVTIFSSFLLIIWLLFVSYCWKSGLIGFRKVPPAKVPISTESNDSKMSHPDTSIKQLKPAETSNTNTESNNKIMPFTPEYLSEIENSDIHIIFSTDCNPYQVNYMCNNFDLINFLIINL